ncbi:MAG: multicopper oxidase domain-containing protein [Gemmatimonadaceae bacterium]
MRLTLALASAVAVLASSAPPMPERIAPNDNRTAAGMLRAGVLTVHLEAREGEWRPEGDGKPGIPVVAFAERGKALTAPGPMLRVPEGTEVHALVTNTLAESLVVRGLSTRGVRGGADTMLVAPGATGEARFAAGAPGTYYYRGSVVRGDTTGARRGAVLAGAFVVDPRGAPARAADRVLLISLWTTRANVGQVAPGDVFRFAINGRSWPNTERLSFALGDTVRFRVINVSGAVHPMHLHGFYFDVNSRGDGTVDSVYAADSPPYRVVTERLTPGRTYTMTWVPERAGNWLFHCHDNAHVVRNPPLDGSRPIPEHKLHVTNHLTDMMGGLVMTVDVRGRDASRAVPDGRRRLRLVAEEDSGGTEDEPAYKYVLQDGAAHTPPAHPLLPGSTIVLKRGEPASITVVNRIPEMTSVHWHGIELESYFDGVADFSGAGKRVAMAIAPGDSFVARFTPPRSGTFMYHPHADELRQQQAGMNGVLLVVDDPAKFDPEHDRLVLVTVPRRNDDGGRVLINGSLTPPPIELRAGERYRFRLVNLHTFRPAMIVRVQRDSSLASVVTWRALAKDGMDLPPVRAVERPARQQFGNGEAYDFELVPEAPGDLRLTVTSAAGVLLAQVPIRVR